MSDVVRRASNFFFFESKAPSLDSAVVSYNFVKYLKHIRLLEMLPKNIDARMIPIQLTHFYRKFGVDFHCLVLDFATTTHYLWSAINHGTFCRTHQNNVLGTIYVFTYLAHVWNNDKTILLKDWYKELLYQFFPSQTHLNEFVLTLLLEKERKLRAEPSVLRSFIEYLLHTPQCAGGVIIESLLLTFGPLEAKQEPVSPVMEPYTNSNDIIIVPSPIVSDEVHSKRVYSHSTATPSPTEFSLNVGSHSVQSGGGVQNILPQSLSHLSHTLPVLLPYPIPSHPNTNVTGGSNQLLPSCSSVEMLMSLKNESITKQNSNLHMFVDKCPSIHINESQFSEAHQNERHPISVASNLFQKDLSSSSQSYSSDLKSTRQVLNDPSFGSGFTTVQESSFSASMSSSSSITSSINSTYDHQKQTIQNAADKVAPQVKFDGGNQMLHLLKLHQKFSNPCQVSTETPTNSFDHSCVVSAPNPISFNIPESTFMSSFSCNVSFFSGDSHQLQNAFLPPFNKDVHVNSSQKKKKKKNKKKNQKQNSPESNCLSAVEEVNVSNLPVAFSTSVLVLQRFESQSPCSSSSSSKTVLMMMSQVVHSRQSQTFADCQDS